jgi:hypothetical protein
VVIEQIRITKWVRLVIFLNAECGTRSAEQEPAVGYPRIGWNRLEWVLSQQDGEPNSRQGTGGNDLIADVKKMETGRMPVLRFVAVSIRPFFPPHFGSVYNTRVKSGKVTGVAL